MPQSGAIEIEKLKKENLEDFGQLILMVLAENWEYHTAD